MKHRASCIYIIKDSCINSDVAMAGDNKCESVQIFFKYYILITGRPPYSDAR